MKGIFGLVGLLVALAIVGVVVKKRCARTNGTRAKPADSAAVQAGD